jgi:uncharacterized membrane protein
MIFLILGVLVWSGVHLFPSLAAKKRAAWIERMGEGPYKGLFALLLVGAIVLMALGWRSIPPVAAYPPPAPGGLLTGFLMFISLVLFMGSNVPTNLKRFVRHPQLTGVAVWALAHLLANGDLRSLVLFGGIGLWAVLAMLSINRRDGEWQKPEPLPLAAEIKPLVAGIVGYGVFALLHPYIAGVSAFPGG